MPFTGMARTGLKGKKRQADLGNSKYHKNEKIINNIADACYRRDEHHGADARTVGKT